MHGSTPIFRKVQTASTFQNELNYIVMSRSSSDINQRIVGKRFSIVCKAGLLFEYLFKIFDIPYIDSIDKSLFFRVGLCLKDVVAKILKCQIVLDSVISVCEWCCNFLKEGRLDGFEINHHAGINP